MSGTAAPPQTRQRVCRTVPCRERQGGEGKSVLRINVLTELIRLIILALTLPSWVCAPKAGSAAAALLPQPTGHGIAGSVGGF